MRSVLKIFTVLLAAFLLCAGCASSEPEETSSVASSVQSTSEATSSESPSKAEVSEGPEQFAMLPDGTIVSNKAEKVDHTGYLVDGENVVEMPFTLSWKENGQDHAVEIGGDMTVGEFLALNGMESMPTDCAIGDSATWYRRPGTPMELDPDAKFFDYMAGFTLAYEDATDVCINGVEVATDPDALAGKALLEEIGLPWCVKSVLFEDDAEEGIPRIYHWRTSDGGRLLLDMFVVEYNSTDMF